MVLTEQITIETQWWDNQTGWVVVTVPYHSPQPYLFTKDEALQERECISSYSQALESAQQYASRNAGRWYVIDNRAYRPTSLETAIERYERQAEDWLKSSKRRSICGSDDT